MTPPSSERTSTPELVQLFPWDNSGGYTTVLLPGIPTRVTRRVTQLGVLGSLDCSRFKNIDMVRPLVLLPSVAVLIFGMFFSFDALPIFQWIIWAVFFHMCIDYAARFINRRRERRFLRDWESKAIVGPSEFELIISTLYEIMQGIPEDRDHFSLHSKEHLSGPVETERQLMRMAALLSGAPTITPMELHAIAEAIYQYRETRADAPLDFVAETWKRHRKLALADDAE